MLASRKANSDPVPWLGWSGSRYEDSTYPSLYDGPPAHSPRPEYDNDPNPILVAFRERRDIAGQTNSLEAQIDDAVGACDLYEADGTKWRASVQATVSLEHITHARKVLLRLSALIAE